MDWFPALTTTSLLAGALWLARNAIHTRLIKSVEHEFNAKLANLQADLNAKSAEISALRSGALSAIAQRQGAIDKRRLEAVDQVWASATSLASTKTVIMFLSTLNIDAIHQKLASGDMRVKKFIDSFGNDETIKALDNASAAKARPFVSPMVWAAYSALSAVSAHAIGQWTALRSGLDPKNLMDEESVKKLVKVALPSHSDYVDRHGAPAFYNLVEALENQLLSEIQNMLDGAEVDKAGLDRAAEVLAYAHELAKTALPANQVPI